MGDAGRGKSTFAEKLSKKTGIPVYSTDDFFWKVKFTEPRDRAESERMISEIFKKSEWIVEGSTRRLLNEALPLADQIYLLEFKNILLQYVVLIKRCFSREHERLIDLWKLLKHVTYKKYLKGYGTHMPPLKEMLKPYAHKVKSLRSFKEIKNELLEV
jgi:adenylate kinase family enzyme